MDSKLVEVVGRNYLVAELLSAGLEVATPARDRGIDLIAYQDRGRDSKFLARPIQLKAAWKRSLGIHRKYEKLHDLLIVHIWNLCDLATTRCFAMTHQESVAVGKVMGWTDTDSWLTKGTYITTQPSVRLCKLIESYRIDKNSWRDILFGRAL